MLERKVRTHTLVIELPVHTAEPLDYDPLYELLNVVLSVSRALHDGVICDDIAVRLEAHPWVKRDPAASRFAKDKEQGGPFRGVRRG